jgi:mannobiose 2-epimerase
MQHAVDEVHGGFYGAVTNDLQVHNEVPRSAILCGRILWTYAAAYRALGGEPYRAMARRAYDYLTEVFWDHEYGGLYWSVDAQGKPVMARKHHYAQAFGIYGLSEYYRATGEAKALTLAQELFRLLEAHALDPVHGGYVEGSSREWRAPADMRLSDKDHASRKSMNTMLHILEAYTNLLRAWDDPQIKTQQRAVIEAFLQHIIDPHTQHFKLFFDDCWGSLLGNVSYGHDIEGSWLLVEAAEVQGDAGLLASTRRVAVEMAQAVYDEGRDADGSIFYEAGPDGLVDDGKAWWVHGEAIVGFYNAYQLSGQAHFLEAARQSWAYIQDKMIDREHGGWYKQLHRDGTVDDRKYKIGPWECPYHHARTCLEMLARLAGGADKA